MRNTKFIPFIALVAMLSACTLSNGNAKMKKYSKEVSFEDWNAALNEAMSGEDGTGDGNDVEVLVNLSMKMNEKFVSGQKTVYEEKTDAKGTMKSKYDADTNVGYMKSSLTGTAKMTENASELSYNAVGGNQRYYQTMTVKEEVDGVETDVEKTVSVNKEQKEYYLQTSGVQTMVMQYAAMPVLYLAFLPMAYQSADEAEKANYKFYQDGQMYTAVFVETEEEDISTTINEESVVYSQDTTVTTNILQLEYKKSGDKLSSITVRYEQKEEKTRNFVIDYSNYLAGDVRTELEDVIFDATISQKKVELQPVNLTGYIDGGQDASIGFGD